MRLPTRTEKAITQDLSSGKYRQAIELMSSDFVCKEKESPYNWIGEFLRAKAPADIVSELIDLYPDLIQQVDSQNNCALYHAAHCHRIDVIKKLVDLGVDINKELNGFGNCVNVAARFDNKDILKALVSMGASPDMENARGDKAKVIASRWGNYENVDFFEALEKKPEVIGGLRKNSHDVVTEFNI